MGWKKSAAVGVMAVGMTVSVAGSPASSSPDASTQRTAAVETAQKKVNAANKSLAKADNARTDQSARRCAKRRASMREVRRLRVYMPLKRARKIIGSPGRKVSNGVRAWKTCFDSSSLYLHLERKRKKKFVYTISAPIR